MVSSELLAFPSAIHKMKPQTLGVVALVAGVSWFVTSRFYRLKIAVKDRVDRAKRVVIAVSCVSLAFGGLYMLNRAKRAFLGAVN